MNDRSRKSADILQSHKNVDKARLFRVAASAGAAPQRCGASKGCAALRNRDIPDNKIDFWCLITLIEESIEKRLKRHHFHLPRY